MRNAQKDSNYSESGIKSVYQVAQGVRYTQEILLVFSSLLQRPGCHSCHPCHPCHPVKIFRVRKSDVNYNSAHQLQLLLSEAETLMRARTGNRDVNEGHIVYCYGMSTGVPTKGWLSVIK